METNILQPLIEYGYIDSYEKVGDDPKAPKYILCRSCSNSTGKSREEVGSVKDEVGSVKDEVGSVKDVVGSVKDVVGSVKSKTR